MKQKIVVTICTALLLINCQPKKGDPETLKKILTEYFDGIKARDLTKLDSLTTADFVLFENGKIWTNDSLVQLHPKIKTFQGNWTLTDMKVHMDESSGDIVYHNHGDFIINDTIKRQVDWLESATFRKIDGQWKMNFLHSTVKK